MCQQGGAEVSYCLRSEKEQLHRKYEAFQRGDIEISDEELKNMAVRMIMIRDALY